MSLITRIVSLLCLTTFAGVALADDFFVYPKKDQTQQQQQQDKSECYNWAKAETGFDPQATPRTETPPPHQSSSGPDGSIARGAARGALLGEIIDDDAGKGAAAGAAMGAMRRRDRQRQEQRDYERWQQEEAAKYAEKRNRYNRAYKGCMEARDYSVS